MESLAQGEFAAILFLQSEAYENNRKVFLEWVAGLPDDIQFSDSVAAAQAAKNISISFVSKLGQAAGLFAVLAEYKKPYILKDQS